MNIEMLKLVVERCKELVRYGADKRQPFSIEQLEDAVVQLAESLATAQAERDAIKQDYERDMLQIDPERLAEQRDTAQRRVAELEAKLQTVSAIVDATEELNMSNYNHELVWQLNDGMIAVHAALSSNTPSHFVTVRRETVENAMDALERLRNVGTCNGAQPSDGLMTHATESLAALRKETEGK